MAKTKQGAFDIVEYPDDEFAILNNRVMILMNNSCYSFCFVDIEKKQKPLISKEGAPLPAYYNELSDQQDNWNARMYLRQMAQVLQADILEVEYRYANCSSTYWKTPKRFSLLKDNERLDICMAIGENRFGFTWEIRELNEDNQHTPSNNSLQSLEPDSPQFVHESDIKNDPLFKLSFPND